MNRNQTAIETWVVTVRNEDDDEVFSGSPDEWAIRWEAELRASSEPVANRATCIETAADRVLSEVCGYGVYETAALAELRDAVHGGTRG